jgi:hypothetical protein
MHYKDRCDNTQKIQTKFYFFLAFFYNYLMIREVNNAHTHTK